jgi:hypothetical protein
MVFRQTDTLHAVPLNRNARTRSSNAELPMIAALHRAAEAGGGDAIVTNPNRFDTMVSFDFGPRATRPISLPGETFFDALARQQREAVPNNAAKALAEVVKTQNYFGVPDDKFRPGTWANYRLVDFKDTVLAVEAHGTDKLPIPRVNHIVSGRIADVNLGQGGKIFACGDASFGYRGATVDDVLYNDTLPEGVRVQTTDGRVLQGHNMDCLPTMGYGPKTTTVATLAVIQDGMHGNA